MVSVLASQRGTASTGNGCSGGDSWPRAKERHARNRPGLPDAHDQFSDLAQPVPARAESLLSPGLAAHPRHDGPKPADGAEVSGTDGLEKLNLRRLRQHLHLPYGHRARWLALGPVRHKQPDGVQLSVPDIDGPAPSTGQRHAGGGRRRPLTALPKRLPAMPETKTVVNADPDRIGAGKPGRSSTPLAVDARMAATAAHLARQARHTGNVADDPAEPSTPATGPPDDPPF